MDISRALDSRLLGRSFLCNSKRYEEKDYGSEKHSGFRSGFHFVVIHLGIPATHVGHQYVTEKKLSCSGGTEKNREPVRQTR
jgi:hypothetical protein